MMHQLEERFIQLLMEESLISERGLKACERWKSFLFFVVQLDAPCNNRVSN